MVLSNSVSLVSVQYQNLGTRLAKIEIPWVDELTTGRPKIGASLFFIPLEILNKFFPFLRSIW